MFGSMTFFLSLGFQLWKSHSVKFGEWWIPAPENVKTSRRVMVVSCTARVDRPNP